MLTQGEAGDGTLAVVACFSLFLSIGCSNSREYRGFQVYESHVMLCYAYMSSYAYIYRYFFSFFLKIKLDIVKLENVFMIVQMKWPAISPLALLFLSVVDF